MYLSMLKLKECYNHTRTNKILKRLTFYNNISRSSHENEQNLHIKNILLTLFLVFLW